MIWKSTFAAILSIPFYLPGHAQVTAADIQFAKDAVFISSSFARPYQRPSPKGDTRSNEGYNNFTKVSFGYFPIEKLAILPEIGFQTFNRPKVKDTGSKLLPDNLLSFGGNIRYYYIVDPICGAFGVQAGYNSGKYLSGSAPLAQLINADLTFTRPIPFKFTAKKLQLDMVLGVLSGDLAQRNNALYFNCRVGLNYYLNANKIIAREIGAQP